MNAPRIGRARRTVAVLVIGGVLVLVLDHAFHGGLFDALRNVVALVTAVLGILTWVRGAADTAAEAAGRSADAAGKLAADVRDQWMREGQARRVDDPYALPVRWTTAPRGLADHPANVFGTVLVPEPRGGVDQIPALLDRVAEHRLVVLGGSGSGKSVLAIRLALRLIGARERAGSSTRRVPVILGLSTWDPTRVPLREWLARQLAEDYPRLRRSAGALAEDGILPILDGFDELPPSLRTEALRQLDTAGPLVLTSRPDEYAAAIEGRRPLHGAAAITLLPLAPSTLEDYLPRTTDADEWQPVLRALADGDEPLAAVFRLPLMVWLARSVYSDAPAHASELLDRARFPTAAAIEGHLLDALVPAAYESAPPPGVPRWPRDLATDWLRALATRMTRYGQHDLAWWRLRDLCPRLIPRLAVVAGAVTGLGWGAANFLTAVPGPLAAAVLLGVLLGTLYGVPVGLGVWWLSRSRPLHRFVGRTTPRSAARGMFFGVLGGVLTAFALPPGGPTVDNLAGLLGFPIAWQITAGLSVLVGALLFAALAFDERVADLAGVTPTGLLRSDRSWAVVRGAVSAVVLPIVVFWFAFRAELALGPVIDVIQRYATAGPRVPGGGGVRLVMLTLIACLPYVVFAFGALGAALSSQWGAFTVVRIFLWTRGEAPWCFIRFLDDAHRRGVLRRSGAHYQFRHDELQRRLSGLARVPETTIESLPEEDHDEHIPLRSGRFLGRIPRS
ncbi:NACHT domain-containing protein [Cryptosporangium sp. NPDC051539]|uniref:NACHT domain-containing protein n=1 Tax=Cryptosporangium sp. NPDC051539 TaxID=3363962 RepID=UPI00379CB4CF